MNVAFFFSGLAAAAFGASSLFFFKFWRASRDRFFLHFGGACLLIALERLIALFLFGTWQNPNSEVSAWIYLIRLAGFMLIMTAVIEKNRKEKRP